MPSKLSKQISVAPQQISTDARRTTVEVVQSTRYMNVLTVTENELDAISSSNAQSTAFYSISSACFSILLTIIVGAAFTEKLSDIAKAICMIGMPVFFILAIVFLWMANLKKKEKNSIVLKIKSESPKTSSLEYLLYK